jgi:hypothetical protein
MHTMFLNARNAHLQQDIHDGLLGGRDICPEVILCSLLTFILFDNVQRYREGLIDKIAELSIY